MKWDVAPTLQFTGALYDLDRYNQRLADRTAPASSCSRARPTRRASRSGANGFLTDWWQVAGGYAFTDARIVSGFGSALISPAIRSAWCHSTP